MSEPLVVVSLEDLRRVIREELAGVRRDRDLVVLALGVPGLVTGRALLDAHRRGELEGVTRVSRKLVAPRSAIDAWLSSRPVAARSRTVSADSDAELLERAGYRVAPGGRR